MIPIANAIFDSHFELKKILKLPTKDIEFQKLEFIQINKNNFPPIKLIPILNKYHSLPIILNATNEILVDQFLSKKIAFNAIMKNLFLILRDKNFKKYAIKNTNSIKEIISIDNWARNTIKQILTK
jgi:1-deoxy-D-xylulose 5-phosphate reductoisomerase